MTNKDSGEGLDNQSNAIDTNFEINLGSAYEKWSSIKDIAEIIEVTATNREDFIKEARSGAFDGVLAAYRTFGSFSITGNIDNEILEALPKSLKFLCHVGKFISFFE